MKKHKQTILSLIIGIIGSILITAYIQGTFDITQYTKETKVVQLLLLLASQFFSNMIIYMPR